jgi:hypothetical protein
MTPHPWSLEPNVDSPFGIHAMLKAKGGASLKKPGFPSKKKKPRLLDGGAKAQ